MIAALLMAGACAVSTVGQTGGITACSVRQVTMSGKAVGHLPDAALACQHQRAAAYHQLEAIRHQEQASRQLVGYVTSDVRDARRSVEDAAAATYRVCPAPKAAK